MIHVKTIPRIIVSLVISIGIFLILSLLVGLLGSSEIVSACLLATVPVNTILLFVGFTLSQQMDELKDMLKQQNTPGKTEEE